MTSNVRAVESAVGAIPLGSTRRELVVWVFDEVRSAGALLAAPRRSFGAPLSFK